MVSYSPTYAAVIYPDRSRVLGVLLKALSIGQALLLWRIGSPLMLGGRMELEEIVTALYILSRPCSEAAAGLQRRRTRWRLDLWAFQIRMCRSVEVLDPARKILSKQIELAFAGPTLWEDGAAGAKCGAPYLQTLKTRLMECLGTSREEALNYSIREAIWDIAAYAEDHGRAEWVSAEEDATIADLAKLAERN